MFAVLLGRYFSLFEGTRAQASVQKREMVVSTTVTPSRFLFGEKGGKMDSDLRCAVVAAAGIVLTFVVFGLSFWRVHISGGMLLRVRQALRNPAFLSVSGGAFSFLILAKNFSEMITLVFWVALVVAVGFCFFVSVEL